MIGPALPIQTTTAPAHAALSRPALIPVDSTAPAEAVARFVAAAAQPDAAGVAEAGYAAIGLRRRLRGRISGLSDPDSRLSGTAEAVCAVCRNQLPPDADLRVDISGMRADLAGVLQQMHAEFALALAALSQGMPAQPGMAVNGVAANLSRSGEVLIHRAALNARAGPG